MRPKSDEQSPALPEKLSGDERPLGREPIPEEPSSEERAAEPPTIPEEPGGEERAAGRHEGHPARRIVDLPPERHAEALAVLRAGFATVAAEFGLTAENTPSNPAFWTGAELGLLVARDYQLFGAEIGGRVLGCAFAGPSRSRERTWELRHLAVRPDARHQGHGEALVAEAARRAQANGASVLRIGIVADNRRLADWYHQLGFVTVSAHERYAGLVFAVDHLERALTPLDRPSYLSTKR